MKTILYHNARNRIQSTLKEGNNMNKSNLLKAYAELENNYYNCYNCDNCDNCYNCDNCDGCYNCDNCDNCYDCDNCYNCYNCDNCNRCYNCYNCNRCDRCYRCVLCKKLRNKTEGYWLLNKKVTKEVYLEALAALKGN